MYMYVMRKERHTTSHQGQGTSANAGKVQWHEAYLSTLLLNEDGNFEDNLLRHSQPLETN